MTNPLTYQQCIRQAMIAIDVWPSDEQAFLAVTIEEALRQKTTSQVLLMAVITSKDQERKKWKKFYYKAMAKLRNGNKTTPPKEKPVAKPKPVYNWNFESSGKGKSINSILPTNLKAPIVQYTPEVKATIDLLVATCDKEVGWLGTVTAVDNVYTVDRIFIPKQTVSSVETDIDPSSMADIDEVLYASEGGSDRLYYWGHSHVNMAVNPSGQDENQVREYLNACPKFIRAIHNKSGDYKLDFYDRDMRVVFQNLDLKVAFELPEDTKKLILKTIADNVSLQNSWGNYPQQPKNNTNPCTAYCNNLDYDDEYAAILQDPFGVQ